MLEGPRVLESGSMFRLRIALSFSPGISVAHKISPITSTIVAFGVLRFTFVCATFDIQVTKSYYGNHRHDKGNSISIPETHCSGSKHRKFLVDKTALKMVPLSVTLELLEVLHGVDRNNKIPVNSCKAWFTAKVPGTTIESFKSFAISRACKMRIRLTIKIWRKTFEQHMASDICTI